MKKKSRFLTGLLSAVMALSLCAMPAMAEEGSGATTTTTANPVWTQDTGSITIHKYEWNGTTVGAPATGREEDNNLPSDGDGEDKKTPKPLVGAEFTIYQVKDAAWLSKYYSGAAATNQEEAKYKNAFDAAQYYTADNGTYTVSSTYTAYATDKTNDSGTVTFNKVTVKNSDGNETKDVSLPLGLYLVIETKTPDQVTTPCQPFLVSVPMTVKENDKDSKYVPTEWLYDVHVYPKNKTDYGEITLIKKGQVGNDDADVSLSGVTFKLYKFVGDKGTNGEISPFMTTNYTDDLNDITMEWKQIKKSSTAAGDNTGTDIGVNGLLTTSSAEGKITVSGLSAGYYCFVEQGVGNNKAFITDQTPHYFEVKGKTSQEITVANDGTVTKKADSTPAANLELTVTDPRPDVEKKVKDRVKANENDDEYVKASDYSVGDNVPYKVTVKVPEVLLTATPKEGEENNFVFEVTDTPENLKNNQDVKVNTSAGEEYKGDGVDISYTTPENGFTARFTQAALQALVDKKADGSYNDTFTITYTAKLLKDADMTVDGNKNTINLKYSNKIDADGKINPGTSEIEDGAVVYTFSIHVEKRGESKDGPGLPNVKFNVYKEAAAGTTGAVKGSTIGITGEDVNKDFVKVVIDGTKKDDTKYDLVTGDKGEAKVDGLANGTYYLVETATVNGYNLLSGPVKVTIQVSYSESWTAKDDYVGDKLVHHEETLHKEYFGGKEGAPGNGYILTTIINRKGFDLPTTGGFGTLLFSAIGALLVVGGVGVLMSTKKKKGNG